jgi:phosphohistidine phosphatase SixA
MCRLARYNIDVKKKKGGKRERSNINDEKRPLTQVGRTSNMAVEEWLPDKL